jgi:hypothetical protein
VYCLLNLKRTSMRLVHFLPGKPVRVADTMSTNELRPPVLELSILNAAPHHVARHRTSGGVV